MTMRGLGSLAALLVLVAGCISPPRQTSIPLPGAPPPRTDPGAAEPVRPAVSAAATLLREARAERAAGQLASAESAIERALRIEPADPWLWIELGEIKLATGDAEQADAMARKALTLAASDRDVATRARALLR